MAKKHLTQEQLLRMKEDMRTMATIRIAHKYNVTKGQVVIYRRRFGIPSPLKRGGNKDDKEENYKDELSPDNCVPCLYPAGRDTFDFHKEERKRYEELREWKQKKYDKLERLGLLNQ